MKILCFNNGHWHSTANLSKASTRFKGAALFSVFTEMIHMENVLMLVFVSLTVTQIASHFYFLYAM